MRERPALLGHRPAVCVEQPLKYRQPNIEPVVQVALGHELRAGPRSRKPELTQGGGYGVGHDHAAATAVHMAQDIVDLVLSPQLNTGQRLLQRLGKLGIAR